MNAVSRTMLAVAAASMAVLPVAAEAGTRAGDNGATYSVSAPGKGRKAKGEGLVGLSFFFVVALAEIITLTATVAINDGKTPGAR